MTRDLLEPRTSANRPTLLESLSSPGSRFRPGSVFDGPGARERPPEAELEEGPPRLNHEKNVDDDDDGPQRPPTASEGPLAPDVAIVSQRRPPDVSTTPLVCSSWAVS